MKGDNIYFNEQDIKEHIYWSGISMGKIRLMQEPVHDLIQGLAETSSNPIGNYRTAWIMRLRREPGKCKLPRGFGHLSGKQV
tara:strand:- start:13815 stop:14060 length:246 start_codon:yes stop_codon:yes gene_type:complete